MDWVGTARDLYDAYARKRAEAAAASTQAKTLQDELSSTAAYHAAGLDILPTYDRDDPAITAMAPMQFRFGGIYRRLPRGQALATKKPLAEALPPGINPDWRQVSRDIELPAWQNRAAREQASALDRRNR